MRYVVVLDTDEGTTDYKVFAAEQDARKRFEDGRWVVLADREIKGLKILRARLFLTKTDDAREAKALVLSERAELLEDTKP